MAKFSSCIRNRRSDGLYPVYIRVYHNGQIQYINTGLLVSEKGLKVSYSKTGKKHVDVNDKTVLKECMNRIAVYAEKTNMINSNAIDCRTLVEIITNNVTDLSFTEYATGFINRMKNRNRDNPAKNYILALSRLQKYLEKDNILFRELTGKVISNWIDSMNQSARSKSLYPSCVRTIFNDAIRKYNDYDLDIIRIRTNPFMRVKIPKQRIPEKRSVDSDVICKILTSSITQPVNRDVISRREMARDAANIIFCLAGINAADLYDLKETALNKKTWILSYNRKKTRDKSDSGAYMEITVLELIRPLFDKYKGVKEKLFVFSKRYSDENNFVKAVNIWLSEICSDLGITEHVTTYTFSHSWATIAQNRCGVSTEQVAFALNHSSVHKITEGYIRKDYTPADILNGKVIDYVMNGIMDDSVK